MTYLNIYYEIRRHDLEGQQLATVLGLPPNDAALKLYGEIKLSLYEIKQLADLLGRSLDYPVRHRVVARTYSPGGGIDSAAKG